MKEDTGNLLDRLLVPYNHGFIGAPQTFEVRHGGEWGPPILRESEIEWEPYCFVLIVSDFILTVAWLYLLRITSKRFRVTWMSPTMRFSIASIYACFRISLILYVFRSKPQAIYRYLAVIAYIIHVFFGVLAFVFNIGPWSKVRSNSLGVYSWNTPLNPLSNIQSWFKDKLKAIEYRFIYSVHKIANNSENNKESKFKKLLNIGIKFKDELKSRKVGMKDVKEWFTFEQLANTEAKATRGKTEVLLENQIVKLAQQEDCLSIMKGRSLNPVNSFFSNRMSLLVELDDKEEVIGSVNEINVAGQVGLEDSCSQSTDVENESPNEETEGEELIINAATLSVNLTRMKFNEAILFFKLPELKEHFQFNRYFLLPRVPIEQRLESYKEEPAKLIHRYAYDKETETFVEVADANSNVASDSVSRRRSSSSKSSGSGGSGNKKRSNSITDINIIGWSALNDFVDEIDPDFDDLDPDLVSDDLLGSEKKTKRALLKLGFDGLIYEIRTEDVDIKKVLNLPNLPFKFTNKKIKMRVKKRSVPKDSEINIQYGHEGKYDDDQFQSESENQLPQSNDSNGFFLELIGKTMECHDGLKTFYFYAEYRSFRQVLSPPQKESLLWLMNKLNGVNEKRLSSFRVKNSFTG